MVRGHGKQRVVHRVGPLVGENRVRAFEMPDGRSIEYRVSQRPMRVAGGTLRQPARYEVSFADQPDGARLTCDSDVDDLSGRRSLLTCHAQDRGVHFVLSPETAGCSYDDHWRHVESDPACWTGEIKTPGGRYEVEFGSISRLTVVDAQIVWRHETGAPVQAVDGRGWEHAFELALDPDRPQAERDVLQLHAVALHVWGHREIVYWSQ